MIRLFRAISIALLCAVCALAQAASAQQYPANLYQEMQWRMIGPFRGGRTRAVAGVPSQPNVFYIGAVDGGVWKSTDYGRTWEPIFDGQPSQSIGAIAVSPSDPEIIYVGSGEGLHRPGFIGGRRNLQIHRRWKDVDSPRFARRAADSGAGNRSARS